MRSSARVSPTGSQPGVRAAWPARREGTAASRSTSLPAHRDSAAPSSLRGGGGPVRRAQRPTGRRARRIGSAGTDRRRSPGVRAPCIAEQASRPSRHGPGLPRDRVAPASVGLPARPPGGARALCQDEHTSPGWSALRVPRGRPGSARLRPRPPAGPSSIAGAAGPPAPLPRERRRPHPPSPARLRPRDGAFETATWHVKSTPRSLPAAYRAPAAWRGDGPRPCPSGDRPRPSGPRAIPARPGRGGGPRRPHTHRTREHGPAPLTSRAIRLLEGRRAQARRAGGLAGHSGGRRAGRARAARARVIRTPDGPRPREQGVSTAPRAPASGVRRPGSGRGRRSRPRRRARSGS